MITKTLINFIIIFIFACSNVYASDEQKRAHRIEASFSFEHLSPNATYGDWKTLNASYFSKPSGGFTYFVQSSFYKRKENEGLAGTIGAYKDWKDYLYTYSSITAGSNTSFLPQFRVDNDFNFKLGSKKKLVLTFGGSYIKYFTDHKDFIISGGPTYYLGKWIFQYRYFHNQSDPGSVNSHSQLLSAGYGQEDFHWSWITYSFGNQAYMATYLIQPEEVNLDSFEITLKHRHWLGKHYGIFGDISYLELDKGYDKVSISLGLFYKF